MKSMYHTRAGALAALTVLLFGLAFVAAAPLAAQEAPALRILSPADGATIDGPVVLQVELKNFRLDASKIGKPNEPGVGHLHVNIDGKYAGLAVSDVMEIPNDGFPTISAGEHTVTVFLQQNNHAVLEPTIEQTIKLKFSKDVTHATPMDVPTAIKVVAPTEGATVDGPMVIRVEPAGFRFDGVKLGKPNEAKTGHWHVNVDGKVAGMSVTNVLQIPNDSFPTLTAGQHEVSVYLQQNDHALLDPPVGQTFRVNVAKDVNVGTPAAPQAASLARLPNTGIAGGQRGLALLAVAGCMLSGLMLVRRSGMRRGGQRS